MEYLFFLFIVIAIVIFYELSKKNIPSPPDSDVLNDYKHRLSILEQEKIELIRSHQKVESQVDQLNNHYLTKDSESQILIEKLNQDLYYKEQSRKTTLSQKKSSEVRLGNIAEKLAPFLEDFPYNPEDAIFAGQPIDYIVFDHAAVVFVEIKSGNSQLSTKQRRIRDLIKSKCVEWKEIRIK
jgi:predicted Holliday junction resolvase-like endonuclease